METIAFLFPGQGSQYVGMGRELAAAYPEAAAVIRDASEWLGEDLADLLFEGPEDRLTLTANAQPAILSVSLAAAAVLRSLDIKPAFVAGHSLGEYGAVTVAGGLESRDAVRLVRTRGEIMNRAMPPGKGAMAAILGMGAGAVEALCREAGESATVANLNAPGQVVISGLTGDVERAMELAAERGARRAVPLPVSGAFHSALMEPAAAEFRRHLDGAGISDLAVPLVANVDARPHLAAAELVGLMARQMASPVRWEESMRLLAAEGVTVAVEVGPRTVLGGLMKRIVPGVRCFATDSPANVEQLIEYLGSGGRNAD